MKRRRHTTTGTVTPTPSSSGTMGKLTHVRDPRATVRFSLDERVAWHDVHGRRLATGTIVGFAEDNDLLEVRLNDGSVVWWSTFSARLKRLPTDLAEEPEDPTIADLNQVAFDVTNPRGPLQALRFDDEPYVEVSVRDPIHDEPTRIPGMTDPGLKKRR